MCFASLTSRRSRREQRENCLGKSCGSDGTFGRDLELLNFRGLRSADDRMIQSNANSDRGVLIAALSPPFPLQLSFVIAGMFTGLLTVMKEACAKLMIFITPKNS